MLVTIFSNSQKVLTVIQKFNFYTKILYLRNLIYQKTLNLENNSHLATIKQIPSCIRLVGHDKANQNVKNKAQKRRKPIKQWSFLTYIKKLLDKLNLQEMIK